MKTVQVAISLLVSLLCALEVQGQITLMPDTTKTSATNVMLAWDPSPSSEAVGYYLYYGTDSGVYAGKLDTSNSVTVVVGIAPRATTYFFAVAAYDADGVESPVSDEISYSVPDWVPQSPLVLSPGGPLVFGSTNQLATSGGSGTGSVTYSVISGPALLTGALTDMLVTGGTGVVVISATKAGDDVYLEASATNTITVTPAAQAITFAAIPNQKETNTVALSATSSSGLPVGFAVQSGPGVITGNNLSFVGGGTVVIVASQPGDDHYYAASPVAQTINVTPMVWPSIGVSADSLAVSGLYGSSNLAPATLDLSNSGEIPITFTSSIAYSANGSGWLSVAPASGSIPAYGSTRLSHTANAAGLAAGVYYATNTATSPEATNGLVKWVIQLTVSRANQATLAFNPPATQVYGTTNVLSTAGGSGTGSITYSVLSGPGAIIGGSNLVITAGSGLVVVQATKASDTNFNSTNITASVSASKASQSITFPTIPDQKNTNIVTLVATSSSKLAVSFAVVSGPAKLTGNQLAFTGTGTVKVSAGQSGDANYYAATSVTNTFQVTSYLKPPGKIRVVTN